MSSTELLQAIVTALVLGSLWGLLGTGFGLIFGITGRFHFAFATTMVAAVYLATALVSAGAPNYVAILAGVCGGVILGVLIERFVYQPLVRKSPESALLGVFVTALGLVIAGENVIRLVWGSDAKTLDPGFAVKRIGLGNDVGLTTLDLATFLVCIGAVVVIWVYLSRSRHGRAIRAVRDNPDMAQAVGVNVRSVYLAVFALGSLLSGIGGVLLTMRGSFSPDSGLEPTFIALVVTFLAGARRGPLSFLAAGLVVGLIQNVSQVWISPDWTPAVTFGILFFYIALTPLMAGRSSFKKASRPPVATSNLVGPA